MNSDVTLWGALLAGLLSFVSPCVLPLVPPYLCYMAGVSVDDFRGGAGVSARAGARGALLSASIAFVLGFSTVFVALGAGASTIGHFLRVWQEPLAMAAGVLIIVIGLNFLGILKIPLLSREARFRSEGKPASVLAAYVMGLAFAFGWTPCIGPILATILAVAASQESLRAGVLLLAAYSLGLGIPFLAAAFAIRGFLAFARRIRRHMQKIEIAAGLLLAGTGLLMAIGSFEKIAIFLLNTFPTLAKLG